MKKTPLKSAVAVFTVVLLLLCTGCRNSPEAPQPDPEEEPCDLKPVIYLYPEKDTDVTVTLCYDGILTCTYPEYGEGWHVTAHPDGTLTDEKGTEYSYLYWEGAAETDYSFSEGFCVAAGDAAEFLETVLDQLGLTRKEANEFIVYWLPVLQSAPYHLISFQSEAYTDHAELTVTPAPDTVIRVFMACLPLEEKVDITPQSFYTPERTGFTVVEWGGSIAG